jgi:hypothetical protein
MAELHQCAADGQSSPLVTTCSSAADCDQSAGACRICVPNTYYCSDIGELQLCSNDGHSLDLQEDCGEPALCDSDHGMCQPGGAAGAPPTP